MGFPSIDWEELRLAYNRMFKTNHKTVSAMIIKVYKDNGSLTRASELLGVSRTTLGNKLRYITKLKSKGGNNHVGTKKKLFLDISVEKMKNMTKLEIAKECNMSIQYASKLIRDHNRSFIRVLNGSKYYAKNAKT